MKVVLMLIKIKNSNTVLVVGLIVAFTFALCAIYILSSPYECQAKATAVEDLETLVKESNSIKSELESSQQEYLSATQVAAGADAEAKSLSQSIEQTEKEIAVCREKYGAVLRSEYRSNEDTGLLTILTVSENFDEALTNIECYYRIKTYYESIATELSALQTKLDRQSLQLETKQTVCADATAEAEIAKERLNKTLSDLKPRITELRTRLGSELAGLPGSSQADNLLSYLSLLDNAATEQALLIQSAYTTEYAGADSCEAWAEQVYRNAGISVPLMPGALDGYEAYCVSDSKENIPPGAWVYGSGSGSMGEQYGHVGIYVGNGLIMDNEASRTGKAVQIDKWISAQTATGRHGQGWLGWGYPHDLTFAAE